MDKKNIYLDRITEILNEAGKDENLPTEDYADLCEDIADDARSRADAARADLAEGLDDDLPDGEE